MRGLPAGAWGSEGPDQVVGKGKGKSKKGKGRGRGGNPATVQSTNPGDNIPKTKTALQEAKQVWGSGIVCHVILKPCDHGHAKAMNHAAAAILECKSWGTSLRESETFLAGILIRNSILQCTV